MAYLAFEKMRLINKQRFGKDTGPFQPVLSDEARTGFDLKSAVLRFLHERCENLLFDGQIEEEEEQSGVYRGTSLAPNQIPYNMQMDINRLCLERELERFSDNCLIARYQYDETEQEKNIKSVQKISPTRIQGTREGLVCCVFSPDCLHIRNCRNQG